jgi:hypothetical protein
MGRPRGCLSDYTLLKPSYLAVPLRGPWAGVLRGTDDFHGLDVNRIDSFLVLREANLLYTIVHLMDITHAGL